MCIYMHATTNGAMWQKALAHLHVDSWGAGRVPSARNWLDFFRSCLFSHYTEKIKYTDHKCIASLPLSVHQLIGESIVDAVTLARLRQLVLSSSKTTATAEVFKETYETSKNVKPIKHGCNLAPHFFQEAPEDVCGVFLGTETSDDDNNNNNNDYPSELMELLCYYSAAYQSPNDLSQLEFWLRDTVKFLQFFTLHILPQSEKKPSRQLYITYTELLCVLHYGLCTLCLRPSHNTEAANIIQTSCEDEAALLLLWLLREFKIRAACSLTYAVENNNNNNNNSKSGDDVCFKNLLRDTQMLLALRKKTCAWLLHMPALLRIKNVTSEKSCVEKKDENFLVNTMEHSFICRLARDIVLPLSFFSASSLATVCVPFVDELAVKDEAAVSLMHEQLSRIASGEKES